MSWLLILAILLSQYQRVLSYKPVVIIHGILDKASSLNDLKSFIEKAHPGTNVTVIKLYPDVESILTPMWDQIQGVSKVLKSIMAQSKNGIHLIGFSQGIKFHLKRKYLGALIIWAWLPLTILFVYVHAAICPAW